MAALFAFLRLPHDVVANATGEVLAPEVDEEAWVVADLLMLEAGGDSCPIDCLHVNC